MKKITFIFFAIIALALPQSSIAQNTQITLEGIWKNDKYKPKRVPGFRFMNDGVHYTRKMGQTVVKYTLVTGEAVQTLFDATRINSEDFDGKFNSYTLSDDEEKMLIKTQSEAIYRRSSKALFYVYSATSEKMEPVFKEGKIMHCTFSPDGKRVAFVYENNLYHKDLGTGIVLQVTDDGMYNHIINASTDWVYEEEFGFSKAFEWSPDSKKIAFYRFDESGVKEFPMEYFRGEMYPELVTFKYPKVGEENAIVSVRIHDIGSGKTVNVDRNSDPDGYIPRIKWTEDDNTLCVFRMNRHQNHLELLLANAQTGATSILLEEKNKYYIEITDDITFLKDGEHFIWSSEHDGYNHMYLYDMSGAMTKQLTSGEYDVISFYGVDEERGLIYYVAAKESPMTRQLFSAGLNGKGEKMLAGKGGAHTAQFSSTFEFYVRTSSSANTAPTYTVVKTKSNKDIRVIEDNAGIGKLQSEAGVSPMEFFEFKTSEGVSLNGWMIKPTGFDEAQQYPVFMYLYGGPGSQQVMDNWRGANYWWFEMLAQQGYIVACVDNRGTGARGEEFRKMTYQQLGHYETIDQIEAAKYLGGLPYTDAGRIGIFGWSYGGYMSSLCILKGNDVFKSAIAVAPVTNWKWYDSIYTERFMRTENENPEGYSENSPINFVDRLKGDYLLVHGIADDNVHWQHTVEMANALIGANKQYDTYFYPNRNHRISGDNARLHLFTKMTNFIHRSLGDRRGVVRP
jgi:dipeptidyl-peptidase-4